MKTHKIMIVAEVVDDADYEVIRDAIGDFPEVVDVEPPKAISKSVRSISSWLYYLGLLKSKKGEN